MIIEKKRLGKGMIEYTHEDGHVEVVYRDYHKVDQEMAEWDFAKEVEFFVPEVDEDEVSEVEEETYTEEVDEQPRTFRVVDEFDTEKGVN